MGNRAGSPPQLCPEHHHHHLLHHLHLDTLLSRATHNKATHNKVTHNKATHKRATHKRATHNKDITSRATTSRGGCLPQCMATSTESRRNTIADMAPDMAAVEWAAVMEWVAWGVACVVRSRRR